jgi:hypothetical protein
MKSSHRLETTQDETAWRGLFHAVPQAAAVHHLSGSAKLTQQA